MTTRCAWANSSEAMIAYHDSEWGRAAHDDRYLFEFLILEEAQAGLSWATVLNKRHAYRELLRDFDPEILQHLDEQDVERLMRESRIIRNRLKLASIASNASAFLAVQNEFGSFDRYLWSWTDGAVQRSRRKANDPVPTRSALSDSLSKDLKKRGFKFVGTTISYAYLQAVGIIDDHDENCLAVRT